MAKIKVTQVKSSIKRMQSQKRTHEATPNIIGMIDKVKHLVKTTEV